MKSLNSTFEAKINMKSYGNQTISDNSLLDIKNGIILYPLEGNLIIFDCNNYKEINRIFITYSLIKIIKKIPGFDNYLLCCENSHIFILDKNFNILYDYKPKEINNVYSLDISIQLKNENIDKIYQYIAISHRSIFNDENYYLIYDKDALSLIEMEINLKENKISNINFKKIFTKPSFNDFSVFNYVNNDEFKNLELISFHWDENDKKNMITIYKINENNIKNNSFKEKEKIIYEMTTEMKRYKKLYYSEDDVLKIVILCKKRNMYIFNLKTKLIDDSFQLEGVGEPGEFFIDNTNFSMLMVNTTSQLININISEKIYPKTIPLEKSENNLSEVILKDDFIRSMCWSLISVKCKNDENKIIIVNAAGIKIYVNRNGLYEDYYSSSILKMSGCGACTLSNNIFIYGDLSGNITIFEKDKEKYEQIQLDKEMIRAICTDKKNNIIYIGTVSGKIFKYNYNEKKLSSPNNLKNNQNLSDNNNNETITCLKYLYPNLYFSDTGGNVYIYNVNKEKIIYDFLPHKPQVDNTNMDFGSLSIKSEVWSFLVHEINDENLYIITGSEDQSIKIWKVVINDNKNIIINNSLLKEIKEHKYAVTCLDWTTIKFDNANREVLLSCSDDKTINIFDSLDEKFDIILKVDFNKCIKGFFTLTYCSFNHRDEDKNQNNNLLCVGTQAGYLIIYDISERKIKFLEKIHYGGIEGVFFENNIISTCGNDNAFNILKINN